ncbi:PREDICTED: endoglucanase 20-like [Fragaria vesca subsp. vesca]|uniref:endoglucanase 20-like n=1 Tax=Fragaria vesca subsp. vesca TaxID=101020 RepID=UPI0002C3404B|nr:PREDICTED: endoglucanase 20-like [Fragaria vesca subsp. vesca]
MMRHGRVVACVLVLWCWCVLNGVVSAIDYKDALGKSILFFEGQRSGKLPNSQRVVWRGDSALSDGQLEGVNLTGGYYDAGDNVKFGWPMAYSVSLLSWSLIEYQQQISSAKQLAYLQGAIRWGTEFIIKAHPSPTTFYTQVGDGNADHQCWERPEDMDTSRKLYKITSSSPGSEAAAEAAAALAAASIVFKTVDSTYSAKLLRYSKSLFDLADKYRGSYQVSCPFYCSYSGYQDELLWAAAWLYKASGNRSYLSYVLNNQGWSQAMSEFSWDNKFVGAQTILAKEYHAGNTNLLKYKTDAESFICAVMPGSSSSQVQRTPGGLLFIRDSSNLQYVTSSTLVLFIYSKTISSTQTRGVQCGSMFFSAEKIKAFAKSQVDYILGANPKKMSYMVGFGTTYPTKVHHRGSSIPSIKKVRTKVDCNGGYTYYNSGSPNPNTHVGAIVGGPDVNDQFQNARSDYSHSEPTTYINAAFVGSAAALLA